MKKRLISILLVLAMAAAWVIPAAAADAYAVTTWPNLKFTEPMIMRSWMERTRTEYNESGTETMTSTYTSTSEHDDNGTILKETSHSKTVSLGGGWTDEYEDVHFYEDGRLVKVQHIRYQADGTTNITEQPISATVPDSQEPTLEKDSQGRTVKITFPDGQVITQAYDEAGNMVASTNTFEAYKSSSSWTYDAQGRLLTEHQDVETTDSDGEANYSAWTYRYTGHDAQGRVTGYSYESNSMQWEGTVVYGGTAETPTIVETIYALNEDGTKTLFLKGTVAYTPYEPEFPEEPTEPAEPTEPTEPAEPTEPQGPTEPVDEPADEPAAPVEYPPVAGFTDIKPGAFYEDSVAWAVGAGVTKGKNDTQFGPDDDCTRGHIVTFLWRAKGSPAPTAADCPFVDVDSSKFYYQAMLWAVENGITNGLDATHFGPEEPCNRAQAVTFLWRAEGAPAPTSEANPFTDATSGFYLKAMLWAVEKGITKGTSATTFGPNDTCSRGHIVTFLYRDLVK